MQLLNLAIITRLTVHDMYMLLTICRGGDTGVASQLSSVDIDTVLCTLMKALDQTSNDADNSMEEG